MNIAVQKMLKTTQSQPTLFLPVQTKKETILAYLLTESPNDMESLLWDVKKERQIFTDMIDEFLAGNHREVRPQPLVLDKRARPDSFRSIFSVVLEIVPLNLQK